MSKYRKNSPNSSIHRKEDDIAGIKEAIAILDNLTERVEQEKSELKRLAKQGTLVIY